MDLQGGAIMAHAEVKPERRASFGAYSFATDVLKPGALAGLFGGLLVAVFAVLASGNLGIYMLEPFRWIGASFQGMQPGTGAAVLLFGLLLHGIMSALFGVLFAAIVRRDLRIEIAMLIGMAYGAVLLVLMTFVVLPLVNPFLQAQVRLMEGPWIIGHLLYGACLASVVVLRSRARARSGRRVTAEA
jgi:uncharacterized membrane protein YagU involved in acid resistance